MNEEALLVNDENETTPRPTGFVQNNVGTERDSPQHEVTFVGSNIVRSENQ